MRSGSTCLTGCITNALPGVNQLAISPSATYRSRRPTAVELRGEIRRQFDAQRVQQGDQAAVRFLLSDGKQKLKMLRETLAMQT